MEEPVRRVVFRAEVGAESPLWDEQGAMIWLDMLPLPPDLQDASRGGRTLAGKVATKPSTKRVDASTSRW